MAPEPWFPRLIAALALAGSWMVAGPEPASAQQPRGWELCNESSFVLEAATGRPQGRGVLVQGWTRIRPGECRTAVSAPLPVGPNFVFARSSKAHRGGQRTWDGDVPLCVDANGSFQVESPSACTSIGLESRNFLTVKIDRASGWRTYFRETEPYGPERAQDAGLQRLLDDAGIQRTAIDGYLGRNSRAAIQEFISDRKLPANVSDADLVDILEDVALNRSLDVGLMLCNRTDKLIWAGIARRRSDGWESRGWWTIEGGGCARAVDEALLSQPHYVYAELAGPQGPRKLLGADETFCVARSKFAISGRDQCEARAFREEDFLRTESPVDGKLVVEFFDRSFTPAPR
ncbi:DUF1036 domain-containing protein [bacterium]|nr:DUF1036 domain-containing protein [bacterium]